MLAGIVNKYLQIKLAPHAIVRYPVVVKNKTAVKNGTSGAAHPRRDVVTINIKPEYRARLETWKEMYFRSDGLKFTDAALVRAGFELWMDRRIERSKTGTSTSQPE
jgi:hypothetical protein